MNYCIELEPVVYTVVSFLNQDDAVNFLSTTKYIFDNYDTDTLWQRRWHIYQNQHYYPLLQKRFIKKSVDLLRLSKKYTIMQMLQEITNNEQYKILVCTLNRYNIDNIRLVIQVAKMNRYQDIQSTIVRKLKTKDTVYKYRLLLRVKERIHTDNLYDIITNFSTYANKIGLFHRIQNVGFFTHVQDITNA